jgi:hypothetical protein
MSARDIMERIERERREQIDFRGFQRKDPTKEALAAYAREKADKRRFDEMPAGGLFDETAKAQQDMF